MRHQKTIIIGCLLACLSTLTACDLPIVPMDEFVNMASELALLPEATCEELKVSFGVPHLQTVDVPSEAGIAYEEVMLENISGELIRVWYIPSTLDRGTVILSNGAVGNMACFLYVTHMLRADGWSVVMYDFQGFGGSTGQPSLLSLYGDLDVVLDWTLARTGREQVTLMGVSIGTIPSVAHAVSRPDDVNAIVLDGPISLTVEVAAFAALLGGDISPYMALLGDEALFQAQFPRVRQPTFVFLYGLDEFATAEVFEEITADLPPPMEIIKFPHLPHARGPYLETATYFYQLDRFLASVWSDLAEFVR